MTQPLTADLCARAIVGACEVYKTPPLRAFEAGRGTGRSALMAAAAAVQKVTGAQRQVVARILHVHPVSLARCEREGKPAFQRAVKAASRAAAALEAVGPGTVVAPPPVAPGETGQRCVDHTDAIREALRRHKAKGLKPRTLTGPVRMPQPYGARELDAD